VSDRTFLIIIYILVECLPKPGKLRQFPYKETEPGLEDA
jgi:hypothetical protein